MTTETVLVTGGAGFVGSHVVDAFVDAGYRVVIVDDLSNGCEANLNPSAKFYQCDICSPQVEEIFQSEQIDWISHHAAQIDVRKSVTDPVEDVRVNILGLLNILQCARQFGIQGICYASSGGAIHGEPEVLPVSEHDPKNPLSPYGVSKLSGEYYLHSALQLDGIPYVSLRYANVYGPRQDPLGEAGVVAIFISRMQNRQPPVIFGDGEQTRDYVYVGDVARANLAALKHLQRRPTPATIDEGAFNISTGVEISVNALYDQLKRLMGYRGDAVHEPQRDGEIFKIALDAAKSRRILGWEPETAFEDGLSKTIESIQTAKS